MKRPSLFSRLRGNRIARSFAAAAALASLSGAAAAADITWNFGAVAPGSAEPSSATVPHLTVSAVTQGNNNGTTTMLSTSVPSTNYAEASASYNAGVATNNGPYDSGLSTYFEVTLTPETGYSLTLSEVTFGTRRTGTGPVNYSIRTSADSFGDTIAAGTTPTGSLWGLLTNTGLNVPSSTPLTIRIYGTDGAGAVVNTAVWRIDDLKLSVVVVQDGTPAPTISDVSPLSGTAGTAVTITGTNFGATPAVRFNGTISGSTVNPEGTSISTTVPGGAATGNVTVTTAGGVATSVEPFTVIAQPVLTVQIAPATILENAASPAATGTVSVVDAPASDVTVTLGNNTPTAATVPASVIITAGNTFADFNVDAVPNAASFADATATITATAPGYDQGTATVTVQNTDAQTTTVVVNKYFNSGAPSGVGDIVELLVIGDGTPVSTVDMRRMLLKDHSGSMGTDNGGKLRFNNITEWSAVKAGTLIVVTSSATTSADTDPADYLLRLGLLDTVYFTVEAGTFDIAGTEMVMIKGQDASASGSVGSIHALAGGVEGTTFTTAPPKKLIAPGAVGTPQGTSPTGKGVIANNATSSLADYDGTGATGEVVLTSTDFGVGNNNANKSYIRALRGEVSVDGVGTATITNATPGSPHSGKNFFPRASASQTVAISLVADAGTAALTSVKITVPAALGAPDAGSLSVTGTGAGTPAIAVSEQEITITGTAITTANAALVSIGGLSTPNPTAVTDDGRYTFNVLTTGDSGTLTAIASSPVALVRIPVASVRDVDANGVALDAGKSVAIEVVVTAADLDAAVRTSAFGQDGDFGINIFVIDADLALIAGHRYAISGQIIQFNGLTEITPGSAANVTDLGAGADSAPHTITVADLLANPEAFEGRLIKIAGLNYVSGTWGAAVPLIASDASAQEIGVRVQTGSTATVEPLWPANITGIFGQSDGTAPATSGYQIMPRTAADIESLGTGGGYDGWAAAYPGIGGPEEDADSDGVSNLMEYATGSIPNNPGSLPQSLQTLIGPTLTVTWAKGATAAADPALAWSIEASTSLAAGTWSVAGVTLTDGPAAISGDYIITPGEPKVFFHLKVVRTP